MAQRPYPSYWIYKDSQRLWRWTYEAANGRTIAVSSESYHNKQDCLNGIYLMQGSGSSPIWGPADD